IFSFSATLNELPIIVNVLTNPLQIIMNLLGFFWSKALQSYFIRMRILPDNKRINLLPLFRNVKVLNLFIVRIAFPINITLLFQTTHGTGKTCPIDLYQIGKLLGNDPRVLIYPHHIEKLQVR